MFFFKLPCILAICCLIHYLHIDQKVFHIFISMYSHIYDSICTSTCRSLDISGSFAKNNFLPSSMNSF